MATNPNIGTPTTTLVVSFSSQLRSRLSNSASGFPSMMRIGGLKSTGNGACPAFVGQILGSETLASARRLLNLWEKAPKWMKKMFSVITKNDSGPVFRFFMDLGDAISYVKRLNVPSGVVGACRLYSAYEHFKGCLEAIPI